MLPNVSFGRANARIFTAKRLEASERAIPKSSRLCGFESLRSSPNSLGCELSAGAYVDVGSYRDGRDDLGGWK